MNGASQPSEDSWAAGGHAIALADRWTLGQARLGLGRGRRWLGREGRPPPPLPPPLLAAAAPRAIWATPSGRGASVPANQAGQPLRPPPSSPAGSGPRQAPRGIRAPAPGRCRAPRGTPPPTPPSGTLGVPWGAAGLAASPCPSLLAPPPPSPTPHMRRRRALVPCSGFGPSLSHIFY